jgi:hypothetical protein
MKKKINVMFSSQGHSMRELQSQYWKELITIENGYIEETSETYTIYLTNGKKLHVDKNQVHSEDEHRIIYVGALREICDIPFLFTQMKDENTHEIWHYYFQPGQGGFFVMFSVD